MVALTPVEWVAIGDGVPAEAGAIFWVTYEDTVTGKRFAGLCVCTKRGHALICHGDETFDFGVHVVTHWRCFQTMWPIPAGEA